MAKLTFQQLFHQSSVSHDPSEIILMSWFGAQEQFYIIINVENIIFFWKSWYFHLGFFDIWTVVYICLLSIVVHG